MDMPEGMPPEIQAFLKMLIGEKKKMKEAERLAARPDWVAGFAGCGVKIKMAQEIMDKAKREVDILVSEAQLDGKKLWADIQSTIGVTSDMSYDDEKQEIVLFEPVKRAPNEGVKKAAESGDDKAKKGKIKITRTSK